jgi:mono/diheme cytochrome c family protein
MRVVSFVMLASCCLGGPLMAQSDSATDGNAAARAALAPVKNPYTGDTAAITDGHRLFLETGCNGCHGGGGGGGICPPLINDVWVYGSDDATVFNLIQLGSVQLRAKGFVRVGREYVIGDMPPFGGVIDKDKTLRIMAYIRSVYKGDPSKRNW